MNQNQRRARAINARKSNPLPHLRTAPTPATVLADLDTIDAATTDPTIHAATARIRAALTDEPPTTPCDATEPHADGGLYVCSLTTHTGMHFDEQRRVHWRPDPPATKEDR
ncbi:hypothetical protein [Streptomyces sp. NPDC006267]|uniref:hypothetical protein n=1 Tax=Streptomyces sp. NPDC006267 TaxID=3157173 RepID=UPI0033A49C2B